MLKLVYTRYKNIHCSKGSILFILPYTHRVEYNFADRGACYYSIIQFYWYSFLVYWWDLIHLTLNSGVAVYRLNHIKLKMIEMSNDISMTFTVPTVLEKSLNFGFSLKSPWKWIYPWKVLEFRRPSLKFQLVVLDFLFCVFWTEILNGYSKLGGTRAKFPLKIWIASLAAAYKLDILPVPLAHI